MKASSNVISKEHLGEYRGIKFKIKINQLVELLTSLIEKYKEGVKKFRISNKSEGFKSGRYKFIKLQIVIFNEILKDEQAYQCLFFFYLG